MTVGYLRHIGLFLTGFILLISYIQPRSKAENSDYSQKLLTANIIADSPDEAEHTSDVDRVQGSHHLNNTDNRDLDWSSVLKAKKKPRKNTTPFDSARPKNDRKFKCQNNKCEACVDVKLKNQKKAHEGCYEVSINTDGYLQNSIMYNKRVLYKKGKSLKNLNGDQKTFRNKPKKQHPKKKQPKRKKPKKQQPKKHRPKKQRPKKQRPKKKKGKRSIESDQEAIELYDQLGRNSSGLSEAGNHHRLSELIPCHNGVCVQERFSFNSLLKIFKGGCVSTPYIAVLELCAGLVKVDVTETDINANSFFKINGFGSELWSTEFNLLKVNHYGFLSFLAGSGGGGGDEGGDDKGEGD